MGETFIEETAGDPEMQDVDDLDHAADVDYWLTSVERWLSLAIEDEAAGDAVGARVFLMLALSSEQFANGASLAVLDVSILG